MAKSSIYRGVTLFRPTGKWRAQISANGKTTSLGDHDTEEEAARAFDRAAINKNGVLARTNFAISEYSSELTELQAMTQISLVAMLRSRARKSGTQTSHYRGVSLLKQTGKWHAQINVGGKQVHLGFFATEKQAARAYDRAAINKGARDVGKIITNYDISEYAAELDVLRRISQDQLVAALSKESSSRKATMGMLADGFTNAENIFGEVVATPSTTNLPSIPDLCAKAERATPKPTAKDPIYPFLGRRKVKPEVPQTPPKQEAPVAQLQPSQEAGSKQSEGAGDDDHWGSSSSHPDDLDKLNIPDTAALPRAQTKRKRNVRRRLVADPGATELDNSGVKWTFNVNKKSRYGRVVRSRLNYAALSESEDAGADSNGDDEYEEFHGCSSRTGTNRVDRLPKGRSRRNDMDDEEWEEEPYDHADCTWATKSKSAASASTAVRVSFGKSSGSAKLAAAKVGAGKGDGVDGWHATADMKGSRRKRAPARSAYT